MAKGEPEASATRRVASEPRANEVPGPGWYPDPAAPGRLRWWDGAAWTGHTAGTPGSSAVSTTARANTTGAGRPPASFARRSIAGAVGAALVVVVLTVVLQGGPPALYWGGERIADGQAVLTRAEAAMRAVARADEGAVLAASKCWFVLPNSSAHDVEGRVLCGPALLPWSSPRAPWLAYKLSARQIGVAEELSVAVGPAPGATVALGRGEVLRRPGGGSPPAGADGLQLPSVPRQRRGWGGLLEAPPSGLRAAPVGDVVGDWGATYRLVAYGFYERLPASLDRQALKEAKWPTGFPRPAAKLLLPPRGEEFVVAELAVSPGEDAGAVPAQANGAAGPSADKPQVCLVAGSSVVCYPFVTGPDVTLARAVPVASKPVLEVLDKGLTQRVPLDGGRLGPAPAVLARLGTDERLNMSATLGGARVRLEDASLVWFGGSDGGTLPPSYEEAFLQVLSAVSPAGAQLSSANFKLVLPGGEVVHAEALPDSYRPALVVGFLVPASFSYGTVVVSAGGRSMKVQVRFQ